MPDFFGKLLDLYRYSDNYSPGHFRAVYGERWCVSRTKRSDSL